RTYLSLLADKQANEGAEAVLRHLRQAASPLRFDRPDDAVDALGALGFAGTVASLVRLRQARPASVRALLERRGEWERLDTERREEIVAFLLSSRDPQAVSVLADHWPDVLWEVIAAAQVDLAQGSDETARWALDVSRRQEASAAVTGTDYTDVCL